MVGLDPNYSKFYHLKNYYTFFDDKFLTDDKNISLLVNDSFNFPIKFISSNNFRSIMLGFWNLDDNAFKKVKIIYEAYKNGL